MCVSKGYRDKGRKRRRKGDIGKDEEGKKEEKGKKGEGDKGKKGNRVKAKERRGCSTS